MSHRWLMPELLLVLSQAVTVIYKAVAPKAPELLVFSVAVGAVCRLFGK
jgi:hypothetical protein